MKRTPDDPVPTSERAEAVRGHPKSTRGRFRAKGLGNHVDLYFSRFPLRDRPLVLFQHIQKTAGTSLRHIINANNPDAELELRQGPMESDPQAWYEELYESLGPRREHLVCCASHTANHLLEVVSDRPVRACTLTRDPVDRVLSRYYFRGVQEAETRTLETFFSFLESPRGKVPRRRRKRRAFCNGQARAILGPHYELDELPLVASDAASDLWRTRLLDLVGQHYVLGAQERFIESVQLFAHEFGWTEIFDVQERVGPQRPPLDSLSEETVLLIRRHNWLDEELHRLALDRLDASRQTEADH